MSDHHSFEKPFATSSFSAEANTSAVPSGGGMSHPKNAVSARRATSSAPTSTAKGLPLTSFGAAILDTSASENRPCSVDDRAEPTLPGRWLW